MQNSFICEIQRKCLIFLTALIASSVSDSPSLLHSSNLNIYAEEFRGPEWKGTRHKREIEVCYPPILCDSILNVNIYRTADGTCNNIMNPYWGASNIPFIRRIPRDPPGGDFRCSLCPKPRNVSSTVNAVLPPGQKDGITLMVMQWGQLTDHDLLFTPEDEDPACCEDFRTPEPTSPSCFPIDVTGDSFYGSFDPPLTCLPFVRSKPSPCAEGTDRETINERTIYLDASTVYGSTEAEQIELRAFFGGRLEIGDQIESGNCSQKKEVCPRTFLPTRNGEDGNIEFFAGDHRVEHQPALTSLHTVLVRLHNKLANKLPCGDDETTFQIARKIVGALVQQFTFNEFLPIVLGPDLMDEYDLTLKPATSYFNTFNYGYDPNLRADAPNVFATAAFRFGHSLVPNEFHLTTGTIKLEEVFENHFVTTNPHSHPSHFLSNVIIQDSEPMDHIIVDALINKLLALPPFGYGSDLHARNIKRGRDHGIPGYIFWFNRCAEKHQKPLIETFEDLCNYMPNSVVDTFKELYENVEDIDLFPAGIAEFEVPGGLIGPTFACIIAEQFYHIKYGDRFWFENPGVFTLKQVQSIRETKLASIICDFTSVDFSQENVMLKPYPYFNPKKKCSKILKKGVLKDIKKSFWKHIC
ncbi:UNVERIFIED_CONTAM: hypothetical protein RMT77_001010 [Armadillidium vulgare]